MAMKIWKSVSLGITLEIDYDKCQGHGKCVEECPGEVFELEDHKSTCPGIDDCIECCACIDACPESAIKHSSCEE
jgi:NAD-dependent dihydropyrimidine dehydrogenase PreA subunit